MLQNTVGRDTENLPKQNQTSSLKKVPGMERNSGNKLSSDFVDIYYRPHPKDGESTDFTGVCLSTRGKYPRPRFFPRLLVPDPFPGEGTPVPAGGYSSPRFFPRSLVPGPFPMGGVPSPSQGVPQFQLGGTPVPGSFPGLCSQVFFLEVPSPSQGDTPVPAGGNPIPARRYPRIGYSPGQHWGTPNQDWGTPPWPRHDWGTPPQPGQGYPSKTEQQTESLLCSGRYASCVHAGGLSCFEFWKLKREQRVNLVVSSFRGTNICSIKERALLLLCQIC